MKGNVFQLYLSLGAIDSLQLQDEKETFFSGAVAPGRLPRLRWMTAHPGSSAWLHTQAPVDGCTPRLWCMAAALHIQTALIGLSVLFKIRRRKRRKKWRRNRRNKRWP